MGDGAQIYLSKPGGQREGPYTLAKIKQDLAAKKYRDTDYWAWHEGLPKWVPLYNLAGISESGAPPAPTTPVPPAPVPKLATTPTPPQKSTPPAPPAPAPKPATTAAPPDKSAPVPSPAAPAPTPAAPAPSLAASAPSPAVPAPDSVADEVTLPPEVASGLPLSALEHIFLFTTGDGPAAWQSPEVARMLKAIIGAELELIHQEIPRDVVARCSVADLLKPDGSISDAVWRVMGAHQPDLVLQARNRMHRVCVRTFRIEDDAVVALVLFYNKAKL